MPPFSCVACERNISSKQRLILHLQNQKNPCSQDERGQNQLTHLTRTAPQDGKDFRCPICPGRSYSRKRDLKKHERNVHSTQQNNDDQEDQGDQRGVSAEEFQLKQQVDELTHYIKNMPPTIQRNKLVVNIYGLGKEDIGHVMSDIIARCLTNLPWEDGAESNRKLDHLINFCVENKNVASVPDNQNGLALRSFDDQKQDRCIEDRNKDKTLRQSLHDHFHFPSELPDHRREFMYALSDVVEQWFIRMRNKRSPSHKRLMDMMYSFVQNVEQHMDEDEEQDGDTSE